MMDMKIVTYTREELAEIRAVAMRMKSPSPPKCSKLQESVSKYPFGLGTLLRKGIAITTLGTGKRIASLISRIVTGDSDCGCNARTIALNDLVNDVRKVGGYRAWLTLAPKIVSACKNARKTHGSG